MAVASPPIPAPMTSACAGATSSQCSEYHLREGRRASVVRHLLAGGRARAVLRVCCVLAVMHSLLASRQAKLLVAATLGERVRVGGYRFAFVVQSMVCFTGLTSGSCANRSRAVPRSAALVVVDALGQVASPRAGFWRCACWCGQFNGLPQAVRCSAASSRNRSRRRRTAVRRQRRDGGGGPYRYVRHPNNRAARRPGAVPRMTVNRATLVSRQQCTPCWALARRVSSARDLW
jgi:hypothetical protein